MNTFYTTIPGSAAWDDDAIHRQIRTDQARAVQQSHLSGDTSWLLLEAVQVARDMMWRYHNVKTCGSWKKSRRKYTGLSSCCHPLNVAGMMFNAIEMEEFGTRKDNAIKGLGHDTDEDFKNFFKEARVKGFIKQLDGLLDDPKTVATTLALIRDPRRLQKAPIEERLAFQLRRVLSAKGRKVGLGYLRCFDKIATVEEDLRWLRQNPGVAFAGFTTQKKFNQHITEYEMRVHHVETFPIAPRYIQRLVSAWEKQKKILVNLRGDFPKDEKGPAPAPKAPAIITDLQASAVITGLQKPAIITDPTQAYSNGPSAHTPRKGLYLPFAAAL